MCCLVLGYSLSLSCLAESPVYTINLFIDKVIRNPFECFFNKNGGESQPKMASPYLLAFPSPRDKLCRYHYLFGMMINVEVSNV